MSRVISTFQFLFAMFCLVGGITAGVIHAQTVATQVCWASESGTQVCVPLSVMRATFSTYVKDGPSPISAYRQDLITTQQQLAEEIRKHRECEGILGPLQANQHAQLLQQQQAMLDKTNADAAPDGMLWDTKTQRYISKPPAPKLPAEKPADPKGGRGGH